ncbi:MAG: methylated-DNA--[protein]-cysteine S-methyltransferase [bacterium]
MSNDYELIEKAIIYLENNYKNHPSLKDIADYIGEYEFSVNDLFIRQIGISPNKFFEYTTSKHAKNVLCKSKSILDNYSKVSIAASSRMNDLDVTFETINSKSFKNIGENLNIVYGINETPFGKAFIAICDKGIIELKFLTESDNYINKFKNKWINANFERNETKTEKIIKQIFYSNNEKTQLKLYLIGTKFQLKIWQTLLKIPKGFILSYKDIADIVESHKASRAVGSAIGQNPIHYLIPCHRVLRQNGEIGGYAGGIARKKIILAKESLSHEL